MRTLNTVLLLLLMAPVLANEEAGQVVFVAGSVSAQRDAVAVALKRDNPIYEQDLIVTASRSRGQLLMRDGAKYALRPETRFAVLEYFMAGDEQTQTDGSVVVAANDSAVTELLKGGLRVITGTIGNANQRDFELRTVAATMGIRGTKFSIAWCAGDCELPPGINTTEPIQDGLYIGVSEGTVAIVNNTGEFLLGEDQYLYVRDRNTKPVQLDKKPVALIDTFPTAPAEEDEAAAELIETLRVRVATLPNGLPASGFPGSPGTGAPNGFPTGPNGPITAVPRKLIETAPVPLVAMASGPVPGLGMTAITGSSRQGQRNVSGNNLTALEVPVQSNNTNAIFSIGTSSVANTGRDPVTGFGWGRWSGGAGRVTVGGGPVTNTNLANESLHWAYGQAIDVTPAIPITGTAYYSVIAGNTNPTDTLGNVGVLGGASLYANFTTAVVENLLQVFVGGNEWTAFGSGPINNELFNGQYSVFVNAQPGGTGSFSGFFGAPAANGLPAGAALTYGLTHDLNGIDVSVSGAAVLHPAPAP